MPTHYGQVGGPDQQGGQAMPDIEQLMQLVMQILMEPPHEPQGDLPRGLPDAGVPSMARQPDPEHQQMAMMLQMLQQAQMQQSAQQSMNGAQGGMGGMFGAMGGRPPGS